MDGLTGEYENSVPVFRVWMVEDFTTRDTVFYNDFGVELFRLAAPPDYNPFAYAYSLYPNLYSGKYSHSAIQTILNIHDPARVRIGVKLILEADVEPYLYVEAVLAQQAMSSSGGPMMLMGGGSETNIAFTAINSTNGITMTIWLPDDFTNHVDIYTCNELIPAVWAFAVKSLVTAGTNSISVAGTNPLGPTGLPPPKHRPRGAAPPTVQRIGIGDLLGTRDRFGLRRFHHGIE